MAEEAQMVDDLDVLELPTTSFPWAPIEEQLRDPISGEPAAQIDIARMLEVDVRKVRAWQQSGQVPWDWADVVATRLGVHPFDIWGNSWWSGTFEQEALFEEPERRIQKHGWTDDAEMLDAVDVDMPSLDDPAAVPFWEQRARAAKVDKLVEECIRRGIGPDSASKLDAEDWLDIAEVAGCNPPSATSVAATVEALAELVARSA